MSVDNAIQPRTVNLELELQALISPEIFEPAESQFRIAGSELNVLVAEVQLDRPCILAGVRQIGTRRMAQHVRMNRKFDASGFSGSPTT